MKYLAVLAIAIFAIGAQQTPSHAENHWHISTYWAEYIEGHGAGNHALYCGDETIPACDAPDTVGGIDRSWVDDVEWRYNVADPSQPVTVRMTGLLNYDLPDWNWDFLLLNIQRGEELQALASWTGSVDTTVTLDFTEVVSPEDFSGPAGDEVRLVWRVLTSHDGWDDGDCINPSHGACQIDDLAVYIDDVLITFDDFESGELTNWIPVIDGVSAVNQIPEAGSVVVSAHPNPFNPQTTISFALPRAAEVSLAVYDLQGQLVRVLLQSTPFSAGIQEQVWDGQNAQGQAAASGVYFYRFTAGQETVAGKLTILK